MKKHGKNIRVKLLCLSEISVLKDIYLFFSYNYEVFGECITTYTIFGSINFLQGCLRFKTLKKLDLSLLFGRMIAKNIRVGFIY